MVEEFSADLRTVKHVAHSTLRSYHSALRAFTRYISNRLLPGPPDADGHPTCSTCAGIPYDFHCERCDIEAGLHETYGRTAETCTQQDTNEWLAGGPTTRSAIRTFFVVAKRAQLNTAVTIQHRSPKTSPSPSQDQRLAWIHELLTGTSESLPYRAAGMLLLLYPQPLVRVVTFQTDIIGEGDTGMTIRFGEKPADVPEPFARVMRAHLGTRPNLRTTTGPDSPWLFPGYAAGQHLHPNTVMVRLRKLGINLRGARNRAIGELVLECPPSLVADALGYSHQVAFLHANKAAEPWARYAGRRIATP